MKFLRAVEPADEADDVAAKTSCRIEQPTRRRFRRLSANALDGLALYRQMCE
jgi:hypothetical protein